METPTPIASATIIERLVTVPPVTSSTCLLSTCTAGSARTVTAPITKEKPIKKLSFPAASSSPILNPIGIKPAVTALKNTTRPMNVYTIPTIMCIILSLGSFSTKCCIMTKKRMIRPKALTTSSPFSTRSPKTPA